MFKVILAGKSWNGTQKYENKCAVIVEFQSIFSLVVFI